MNLASLQKENPCRFCKPPRRFPGCCCEEKSRFEERVLDLKWEIKKAKMGDDVFYGYLSDNKGKRHSK